MPAASWRAHSGRHPAWADPGRKKECESRCWMCSIPPVLFLIIEFRAASSRRGRSRDRLGPAFTAGCFRWKRLQRRFVKSRARLRSARAGRNGHNKKSFVRQKTCADEAGCLSRGREKRKRRGLQAGSRRPCVVIQGPGLREPLREPMGPRMRRVEKRRHRAAIVPGPDPSGSLADQRAGRARQTSGGLAQAALAFATCVAIASISAGDRQS